MSSIIMNDAVYNNEIKHRNDQMVWFLCFNGISTTMNYFMPKPSFLKNSNGTI